MEGNRLGLSTYGILEGWRGLVDNMVEPEPLTSDRVEGILTRGGTILRSSRTNPFRSPEATEAVKRNIADHGFDCIVAVGGEDTLSVACKLYAHGIPTVGI